MHSYLAICLGCRFSRPDPSGNGACPCSIDGADIKQHVLSGDCPKGFYAGGYQPAPPAVAKPQGGPGTELKKILKRLGLAPSADCLCNATASEMDAKGGAWSLENIEIIVDVMRSEAAKRKLPFVSAVARMMVRRAVRKAIPTACPTPA